MFACVQRIHYTSLETKFSYKETTDNIAMLHPFYQDDIIGSCVQFFHIIYKDINMFLPKSAYLTKLICVLTA